MILDSLYMWDTAYTMVAGTTGSIAAHDSTNVIDLHGSGLIPTLANLQGARDMGIGDSPALKISCQVTTACTSGGAATLSVSLQGAPDNGSGAEGSYTLWYASPAYALATIAVVGASLLPMDMPRPPAGVGMPRFLKLVYTIAAATLTAGVIKSYLVVDRQDVVQYPAGLTISN